MRSSRPKVVHQLAGRPLLQHVLDTAAALGPTAQTLAMLEGLDGHAGAVSVRLAHLPAEEE